jgi:hypothetical protein
MMFIFRFRVSTSIVITLIHVRHVDRRTDLKLRDVPFATMRTGLKTKTCWCIGCVPRGSDMQFVEHPCFLPFNPLRLVTVFDCSISQGTDFREREHDNVILGESSFHPHQGFLATWPYFLGFPDQNFVIYICATSAMCPIPWIPNRGQRTRL